MESWVNGNLLTLTRESPGQATDYRYTYTGNRQTGIETEDISGTSMFDSNGNMACREIYSMPVLTIHYNLLNLPSEVTTETMTSTCTTLFDGTKRSTTLTSGGETSYRLYLGSFVLNRASSSAGDTTYRYQNTSFAMGRICRSSQGAPAVRVYVPNHLGSTAEIFENNSSVVEENDYYPFGLRTANHSLNKSNRNRWRFCGKEELPLPDDGSHLDFGARIYDALTSVRWLSVDPLADKHPDMSPYSYCNNDPVNRIDPNGLTDYFNFDGDMIFRDTFDNGDIRITTQEEIDKLKSDLLKIDKCDILPHLTKFASSAMLFSEAVKSGQMSHEGAMNIYQHYNDTGLPLVENNELGKEDSTVAYFALSIGKDVHIEVNVVANAQQKKHFFDNSFNIYNIMCIHEGRGHWGLYKQCKMNLNEYVKIPKSQRETHAYSTQMHDKSYEKTTESFKSFISKNYTFYLMQ